VMVDATSGGMTCSMCCLAASRVLSQGKKMTL
jgi:hypothetical protein